MSSCIREERLIHIPIMSQLSVPLSYHGNIFAVFNNSGYDCKTGRSLARLVRNDRQPDLLHLLAPFHREYGQSFKSFSM